MVVLEMELDTAKLVMKLRAVGMDRSKASTLRMRCSMRRTCFLVYVSSVM